MIATKNYNEVLMEFDFAIDLDMAIFKYIRDNYHDSPLLRSVCRDMHNEYYIIRDLLHRPSPNPITAIIPSKINTQSIYEDLMENHEQELLEIAKPCDLLYFMHTLRDTASSVGITIRCNNKLEARWIKKYTSLPIKVMTRQDVNMDSYTVLYIKYLKDVLQYKLFNAKYIYTANARYNFSDEDHLLDRTTMAIFGGTNVIKLIDPYTKVRYTYNEGGHIEDEGTILKYSATGESPVDTETYS